MTLYVVATPIGNLSDITLRAVETLKSVDYVVAEDTRRAGKLMAHLGVKKPFISYFAGREREKVAKIIGLLQEGKEVALITDAGTPCISDPGSILVEACYDAEIEVVPIPGASAVTAALSVSGFRADNFSFLGFFPKKGKTKFVDEIIAATRTIVFYESPHRMAKTLQLLAEHIPERKICIARELTKRYEEIILGTVQEIASKERTWKGELVVIL